MCDKATVERWAKGQLSRREFGALTGAAALTACSGGEAAAGAETGSAAPDVIESNVSFETEDGTMDAVLFHPAEGAYPAVIHWPDIAGIRQSHRNMAARTAAAGYAVLLVNPYYRDAVGEIWTDFADFVGNGGWDIAKGFRANLSSFAIRRDTQAIVSWLDGQPSVDTERGIGAEGYCMGGPFTVYSASEVPSRVKAAASFHGGGLVRDDAESPHKLMAGSDASFLYAIAQDDDAKAPDDKTALAAAPVAEGRTAVVDVYAGDHGWTVPDAPAFAKEEADRAFAAKIELYEGAL